MANVRQRIVRFLAWTAAAVVTLAVVAIAAVALIVWWLIEPDSSQFGHVEDEAKTAHRTVADFRVGAVLRGNGQGPSAVAGSRRRSSRRDQGGRRRHRARSGSRPPGGDPRAECLDRLDRRGGNDRFWDFAARSTIGSFDLLKTISSHPTMAYGRDNRFRYLGLVNEPCDNTPEK